MAQARKIDVAIVGAGTAGLNARREVKRQRKSVVLIEDGPLGTTCARVGCMPSKLLIHAANVAHQFRHGPSIGVGVDAPPSIDGKKVLERVRRERDRFAGSVVRAMEAFADEELIRGHAVFMGPTTLDVEGHGRVDARAVVIAVGSTSFIIPPLRHLRNRLLVNDDLFELQDLPRSVGVIGSGIIGLELGQALHRLGVNTQVFSNLPLLGPATDPVIQEKAREIFGRELKLSLEVDIHDAEEDDDGVTMRWRDKAGAAHEERFEYLLSAAGRIPLLQGLDLENAGIELEIRGIPLFDPATMQCGDSAVFIAGDATNELPVLHEAADEGQIAGANAARFPEVVGQLRRTPMGIVFTEPNMAVVGRPFTSLDPKATAIGDASYDRQGRARVMGQNAGHVRIYAERQTGILVGAEMLGPRVEHTAHLLAWAVQQQMTVCKALEMPFYHPVIEEGIRTGLQDLAKALEVRRDDRSRFSSCPG